MFAVMVRIMQTGTKRARSGTAAQALIQPAVAREPTVETTSEPNVFMLFI